MSKNNQKIKSNIKKILFKLKINIMNNTKIKVMNKINLNNKMKDLYRFHKIKPIDLNIKVILILKVKFKTNLKIKIIFKTIIMNIKKNLVNKILKIKMNLKMTRVIYKTYNK